MFSTSVIAFTYRLLLASPGSFAPHPVTLRQLQYLVAVADSRSFRRAAAACHVSQPSLSAQVAQAERALGVKLFERDRRRVLPHPGGRGAAGPGPASLLLAADDLVAAGAAAGRSAGRARCGSGSSPPSRPICCPGSCPALRRAYRKLMVLWHEDRTGELR